MERYIKQRKRLKQQSISIDLEYELKGDRTPEKALLNAPFLVKTEKILVRIGHRANIVESVQNKREYQDDGGDLIFSGVFNIRSSVRAGCMENYLGVVGLPIWTADYCPFG